MTFDTRRVVPCNGNGDDTRQTMKRLTPLPVVPDLLLRNRLRDV